MKPSLDVKREAFMNSSQAQLRASDSLLHQIIATVNPSSDEFHNVLMRLLWCFHSWTGEAFRTTTSEQEKRKAKQIKPLRKVKVRWSFDIRPQLWFVSLSLLPLAMIILWFLFRGDSTPWRQIETYTCIKVTHWISQTSFSDACVSWSWKQIFFPMGREDLRSDTKRYEWIHETG